MPSSTCSAPSTPGSPWTRSRRASRSSSPRTTTCSRRSRSFAPRGGSTRASCASDSTRTTRAARLRFHTQTGGVTLQAQQPLNNVVRVAVQALVRGARRHAVAAHERLRRGARAADAEGGDARASHAADHRQRIGCGADGRSAGGELLRRASDRTSSSAARSSCSRSVDELGGAAQAIGASFFQEEIARSAYEYQLRVERGETVIVGVNKFADDAPPPDDPDAGLLGARARSGRARAQRFVRERDAARADAALAALRAASRHVCRGRLHARTPLDGARSSTPFARARAWARSPMRCAPRGESIGRRERGRVPLNALSGVD